VENKFKTEYKHPFKLYAFAVYNNANEYHKSEKPILRWLSDEAKKDWKK
jgi:hypothetical protein